MNAGDCGGAGGHLLPDPVDVIAPAGAVAWSPSRGFITSADDLYEARGEGEHVLPVTDVTSDGTPGVIADVEGDAPLACVIRVDREMSETRRALGDLGDRFVGIDTGEATDVAELHTRLSLCATPRGQGARRD